MTKENDINYLKKINKELSNEKNKLTNENTRLRILLSQLKKTFENIETF